MSIRNKIANFLSGKQTLDDFEVRLVRAVSDSLPHEDAMALNHQISQLNSSYRDFDEEKGRAYTYFYKMKRGKSLSNFGERLSIEGEDAVFAVATIPYGGETITARLHSVNGIFFYIEFESSGDIYRPTSPNFTVSVDLAT